MVVCNKEPKRGKNVVKLRTYDQMKSEMSDLQDLLGAENYPERSLGHVDRQR